MPLAIALLHNKIWKIQSLNFVSLPCCLCLLHRFAGYEHAGILPFFPAGLPSIVANTGLSAAFRYIGAQSSSPNAARAFLLSSLRSFTGTKIFPSIWISRDSHSNSVFPSFSICLRIRSSDIGCSLANWTSPSETTTCLSPQETCRIAGLSGKASGFR